METIIYSDPNHIVEGNVGDIFTRIRIGSDKFYRLSGTASTLIDLPMRSFLGKYAHPIYELQDIQFTYSSEIWIKHSGQRTKTGWEFLVNNKIVYAGLTTPTPTITPTPTLTPTVTVTPSPSPTSIYYFFAMVQPPGGSDVFP